MWQFTGKRNVFKYLTVRQNGRYVLGLFGQSESGILIYYNRAFNKPGPAQVGAISKAQKQQKDFQVSSILLQYSKIENFS